MTSSGAELIKLQEDTMKLQQRLYISLIPYTIADDKIKMLQNLRRQSNNITAFNPFYIQVNTTQVQTRCKGRTDSHQMSRFPDVFARFL
jgi:glycopeptide antibiotics resistance protein